MVQGLGFRVWSSRFRVEGAGPGSAVPSSGLSGSLSC